MGVMRWNFKPNSSLYMRLRIASCLWCILTVSERVGGSAAPNSTLVHRVNLVGILMHRCVLGCFFSNTTEKTCVFFVTFPFAKDALCGQ